MRRNKKLHDLRLYTLGAYPLKIHDMPADSLIGFIFNSEIQLRRKAYGAQDPQRVFIKPLVRIPDAADDMVLQIRHSSVKIDEPVFIIIGHRINRKVTAQQVIL